jgi:hypothetical protein
MAWGIEAFAMFDPFYWGAYGVVYSFVVWTLFAYISFRGSSEKPLEESMQLMGYTFGAGLLLDFMGIPALWVGVGTIIAYVLGAKYILKWNWRKTIFVLTTITINLSISALVSEPVKSIYLWGVLIGLMFIVSQQRIRENKIGSTLTPVKK